MGNTRRSSFRARISRRIAWLLVFACLTLSCSRVEEADSTPGSATVTIERIDDTYYAVDMTPGDDGSASGLGAAYGRAILAAFNDYAKKLDAYLAWMMAGMYDRADTYFANAADIWPQVPEEYRKEIDGIASVICTSSKDKPGDGRLSPAEFRLANLIGDAIRPTACSGLGVYGGASEDGASRVLRMMEYVIGPPDSELSSFAAVSYIRGKGKSVCLVGYLGMSGAITGFNSRGVFAAVLDAATHAPYDPIGRYSYSMDIRKALETADSMDDVVAAMSEKPYAFNHSILLCDAGSSAVLENSVSGGSEMRRQARTAETQLRPGVEWGFPDSVCAVNSFLLEGNCDNHSIFEHNYMRWESYRAKVAELGPGISFADLVDISGFYIYDPDSPAQGDIYYRGHASGTPQAVIFEPAGMRLDIAFTPPGPDFPLKPVYLFVPVRW